MYQINYTSPIGDLVLKSSNCGLSEVIKGSVQKNCKNAILELAVDEMDLYFSGLLKSFSVPLDPKGSDFQQRCWKILLNIKYGTTWSYLQLAKEVASIRHCRAVANANKKNPLPIFIPCHRVIGNDGSLTGFAWGLEVKEYLLRNEGTILL